MSAKKRIFNRVCGSLVLTMSLLTLVSASYAGVRDGAGGDGVVRDGKIVLRDFLDSANLEFVESNSEFIRREAPNFDALLNEVAGAHGSLGVEILTQLQNAKIWITEQPLPILPEGVTTVVGARAEVQIATRFGNDIIISMPAFRSVEGEYVLLHEALHGIVPSEGPIHHAYVRGIVRHVKENRGQLTGQKLDTILARSDVHNVDSAGRNSSRILRGLLLNDLEDPMMVGLFSLLESQRNGNVYWSSLNPKIMEIRKWRGFKLSENQRYAYLEMIQKELPATFAAIQMQSQANLPEVGFVQPLNPIDLIFSFGMQIGFTWSECKQYATPEIGKQLDVYEQEAQADVEVLTRAVKELEDNHVVMKAHHPFYISPVKLPNGELTPRDLFNHFLYGSEIRSQDRQPMEISVIALLLNRYESSLSYMQKTLRPRYESNLKACN